MNQLAEALAGELPGPPVRALYVYNCNPAAVAPDQARVLEGLLRDDLFTVVHEQFATDTVDYADIVLPGHDAARARRPPRLVRPSLRDAQPAGDRPAGRVPLEQRRLPRPGRAGSASSPSSSPTTRP